MPKVARQHERHALSLITVFSVRRSPGFFAPLDHANLGTSASGPLGGLPA